jgi:hypothetical protein
MKKLILLIFVGLLTTALAQNETPQMNYFNGGNINFNMVFGVNTMGGGLGSGGFGRVIAPGISYGPASIFTDPAEIGLMKKPMVYLDTKFGISNSTFGFDVNSALNKSITSSTTDFLKDTTTFVFGKGNPRNDTKVSSFQFGQGAEFGAFALALPITDKLTLGFGVYYPFNLSSNFQLSGLRTKLQSIKHVSGQSINIDLPLSASFASNFDFNVNSISIGGAYEALKSKFGTTLVGFSINRYEVYEYINVNLVIGGMLVLKDQEYHFNDPSDPGINWQGGETNAFYWHAQGNFKTSGYGYRLSVVQKSEKFSLVASLDIVPQFTMTDNNLINESYQPKFLKGSLFGKGTDALDIDVNALSLDKPNLTVPTKNSFSNTAKTSYPSTLTIGGDAKLGAFTFGLNFVKYLSDFSFTIDKYHFGKNMDYSTKFSVDVQLADKVKGWSWLLVPIRIFPYFDFDGIAFQLFGKSTKYTNPRYRLEGGVVFGDAIAEGFADPDQQKNIRDVLKIPLPTGLAISREYQIFDKIHVGVLVFGFPDFAFRYGIAYEL